MSRSYKKVAGWVDSNPWRKRLTNKRLRRRLSKIEFEIASGKAYRKEFQSWDICDWRVCFFNEQDIDEWYGESSYRARMK